MSTVVRFKDCEVCPCLGGERRIWELCRGREVRISEAVKAPDSARARLCGSDTFWVAETPVYFLEAGCPYANLTVCRHVLEIGD